MQQRLGGRLRLAISGGAPLAKDIAEFFDALGVAPIDFVATTGDFYCCVVDRAATVRELTPNFEALNKLRLVRGVYVTGL